MCENYRIFTITRGSDSLNLLKQNMCELKMTLEKMERYRLVINNQQLAIRYFKNCNIKFLHLLFLFQNYITIAPD
jgi:hypothetical protein